MDKFEEVCSLVSGDAKDKSTNKFAWSDLVERYPDKWIIYTDVEIVDDDRLFLCNVLEICDDNTRSERKLQYLSRGVRVMAMRTTSNFNGLIEVNYSH